MEDKALEDMTLAELTTELVAVQAARAEIKRVADEGDRAEKAVRQALIAAMEAQGFESFRNGDAQVTRVTANTAKVDPEGGWDRLYAYIMKTGDFDLLHKRLTTTAVQERWDAGVVVDGVVPVAVTSLMIRKVK